MQSESILPQPPNANARFETIRFINLIHDGVAEVLAPVK